MAIWYDQKLKVWAIGYKENIGSSRKGVSSSGENDNQCPHHKNQTWFYWDNDWIPTPDIKLECLR